MTYIGDMMTKVRTVRIILNSIFIVALIGYGISTVILSDPFLFVISFPFALATILCFGILNLIFFCILNFRNKKILFIMLGCLLWLFGGGWIINRYCLPNKFHPISVLGNASIVIFAVFLGWSLQKPHYKRLVGIGAGIFLLLLIGLMVIPSITQSSPGLSAMETLQSLPYLTWVPAKDPNQSGVIYYDEERAFQGINIYNSSNLPKTHLMDMKGRVVHTWFAHIKGGGAWHHTVMCPDGDLLVIGKDKTLVRLDWSSEIKWIQKGRFHHDVAIAENNDIYAIESKEALVFIAGLPVPIIDDYLVILSADGEIKQEISLFHVVKQNIPFDERIFQIYQEMLDPQRLRATIQRKKEGRRVILRPDTAFDILHNNTITIIDQDIAGVCKKGDVLISVRQLDLIGIVDLDQEKLVWSWGPGVLSRQHHPTILENGNILIFDNGLAQKRSRIVELDPRSKDIVWEYEGMPPSTFYSGVRGAGQRLPNGNTLITESDQGHAFEISQDGDIVWEFYNPEIKPQSKQRASLYRLMRITNPEHYPKLNDFIK